MSPISNLQIIVSTTNLLADVITVKAVWDCQHSQQLAGPTSQQPTNSYDAWKVHSPYLSVPVHRFTLFHQLGKF